MGDTPEQAELRRHLHDLRRAAGGVGRDLEIKFNSLEEKISEMPQNAAKDLKYWWIDVDDDFRNLGRSIDAELERFPGRVRDAGAAIANAAVRAGQATRDGLEAAGKKTKESTKNALAAAAGVRRTPMREWHPPSDE